jgi:hypothetical protein
MFTWPTNAASACVSLSAVIHLHVTVPTPPRPAPSRLLYTSS